MRFSYLSNMQASSKGSDQRAHSCNFGIAFATHTHTLGPVVQSVKCLTADPGVESLIPARSHTLVEIDHEIISTIILPSADCQLQAKVCVQSTG